MKTFPFALLIALLINPITIGPAYAADSANEVQDSGQPFVHPSNDVSYSNDMRDNETLTNAKPTNNGKAQYVSGGIGIDGMEVINAVEHDYNLKMLFVADGEYLGDISVNITDHKGNSLLSAASEGPVLLVKMPAGHYTVSTTTSNGTTLTQHVVVSNDHLASYVLRYPANTQ